MLVRPSQYTRHPNDILDEEDGTSFRPRRSEEPRFATLGVDADYCAVTHFEVTSEGLERESSRLEKARAPEGETLPSGMDCSRRLGAVAKLL